MKIRFGLCIGTSVFCAETSLKKRLPQYKTDWPTKFCDRVFGPVKNPARTPEREDRRKRCMHRKVKCFEVWKTPVAYDWRWLVSSKPFQEC